MRHHEIEPVGPPRHGGPYAVAPGWTPSRTPPLMCRVGFLVSLLWWRSDGVNTGRIATTTRRAMRDPATRRRRGANGRMLFLLHPTSTVTDRELVDLHAAALRLAVDLHAGAADLERASPDPLIMATPECGRLVAPGEVWGTWTAWRHYPNRGGETDGTGSGSARV